VLKARRFDLDLAHPAATARRAWVLLGLGLAVLVAAGMHAFSVQEQRSVLARERTAAETSIARLGAPNAPRGSTGDRREASTRAGLTEARQVVRQLHRPWMELLDGLDRTADRQVRLRQMTIDPRFEQLSIEVEAATMRDVLGYTQRLANSPQVRQARLISFEMREDNDRRLVARLAAALETAVPATHGSHEADTTARVRQAQTVAPALRSP